MQRLERLLIFGIIPLQFDNIPLVIDLGYRRVRTLTQEEMAKLRQEIDDIKRALFANFLRLHEFGVRLESIRSHGVERDKERPRLVLLHGGKFTGEIPES